MRIEAELKVLEQKHKHKHKHTSQLKKSFP